MEVVEAIFFNSSVSSVVENKDPVPLGLSGGRVEIQNVEDSRSVAYR
jgi:hypothetical protein